MKHIKLFDSYRKVDIEDIIERAKKALDKNPNEIPKRIHNQVLNLDGDDWIKFVNLGLESGVITDIGNEIKWLNPKTKKPLENPKNNPKFHKNFDHKVIMLPTNKNSDLSLNKKTNKLQLSTEVSISEGQKQHLYIISDEEIKEDDWFIGLNSTEVHQAKKGIGWKGKKIVATTDKSLGEWLHGDYISAKNTLPQIPESFIQAYIKAYNEGKPITEVSLEMESYDKNPLSSTWEEDYIKYGLQHKEDIAYKLKLREDNTVIIHPSKLYTKDEMFIEVINFAKWHSGMEQSKVVNA